MTTMMHQMERPPRLRAVLAAAVGTTTAVAIVLGMTLGGGHDGGAAPSIGGLTPLAPDGGVPSPGQVQIEPGDTAPPTDLNPASIQPISASAPTLGGLTPLAPDGVIPSPGQVQIEPGDTAPPADVIVGTLD
jgi:hypothetical protein